MLTSEESRLRIVAGGSRRTKPGNRCGVGGSQVRRPRELRARKASARAQTGESVSQGAERIIRQVARQRKKDGHSLFHNISVELLRVAFFRPQARCRTGVDGLTWQEIRGRSRSQDRGPARPVHSGSISGSAFCGHYITRADGQQRPLALAALEDTIVQKAACAVLKRDLRGDFLVLSGSGPKRSQHDAMDALSHRKSLHKGELYFLTRTCEASSFVRPAMALIVPEANRINDTTHAPD